MKDTLTLSPLLSQEMPAYTALYEAAFPPAERKPLAFMTSGEQAHAYELLAIHAPNSHDLIGLVITVRHDIFIMIDYLAISPEHRGQGYGHAVIPLLQERYKEYEWFLEIETPVAHAPNLEQRLKRRKFYASAGLVPCDVKAWIYDTPMELWAPPECAPHITYQVYEALISSCFPEDMRPMPLS